MHPLTHLSLALALSAHAARAHGDAAHPPAKRASAAQAQAAEERGFGRAGDPARVSRSIRIDMSDAFRYTPADITVRRGETVKFIVRNRGRAMHEMVIGTEQELQAHAELMRKHPTMEHDDANMAHVRPGARGELVWQFTQPGVFHFACLIPGHYEAGMVGKVTVK